MKRTIVILGFLLVVSGIALGQAGHGGQQNNLRGLKGIRLVVMFARAEAVKEAERPAILKLVEADATAKFEKAGITLFRYAGEIESAGSPELIVYITCDKLNGFVYPLVTKVTLLQRVRLARDPSIEADLATWEDWGIGAPELTVEMIRSQVATEVDHFIKDYLAVNSMSARH